jgi:hypothetical protein
MMMPGCKSKELDAMAEELMVCYGEELAPTMTKEVLNVFKYVADNAADSMEEAGGDASDLKMFADFVKGLIQDC